MNQSEDPSETVQIRVHGQSLSPTLVYLPGLHGDWTLVGGFRRALDNRVCFVEVTYPRTTTWSLSDYATGIDVALKERGISIGWLLGESFGSQVVWEIVKQDRFDVQGIILAGGFARHPAPWMANVAYFLARRATYKFLKVFFYCYWQVSRVRFRRSPETRSGLQEFISRRTEADCRAARHRLHLVAGNDPMNIVRAVKVPVFALAGLLDPIVPWHPARRWLRGNCPGLCGERLLWRADHNVLGTAPNETARQVLEWMRRKP